MSNLFEQELKSIFFPSHAHTGHPHYHNLTKVTPSPGGPSVEDVIW